MGKIGYTVHLPLFSSMKSNESVLLQTLGRVAKRGSHGKSWHVKIRWSLDC